MRTTTAALAGLAAIAGCVVSAPALPAPALIRCLLCCRARAVEIVVEPDNYPGGGWAAGSVGCSQWGGDCENAVYSDITAEIGDVLVFEYGPYHDIKLESPAAATACDFSQATHLGSSSISRSGGFGRITLNTLGTFTYSCSRSGNRPGWPNIGSHCQHGQRVTVNVVDPNAAPANQWQPVAPQFISVGGDAGWVVKAGNAIYEDIVANVGDTLHFAYASFHHVRAKPSLRSKEQRSPHCRVLRAGRDARGQRPLRFLFRHHG